MCYCMERNIHIYFLKWEYTQICIYEYIYIYLYISVHVCIHNVYRHIYIYVHMITIMYSHTYVNIYIYKYIYIYVYIGGRGPPPQNVIPDKKYIWTDKSQNRGNENPTSFLFLQQQQSTGGRYTHSGIRIRPKTRQTIKFKNNVLSSKTTTQT